MYDFYLSIWGLAPDFSVRRMLEMDVIVSECPLLLICRKNHISHQAYFWTAPTVSGRTGHRYISEYERTLLAREVDLQTIYSQRRA
jgi:hypothetical protein